MSEIKFDLEMKKKEYPIFLPLFLDNVMKTFFPEVFIKYIIKAK